MPHHFQVSVIIPVYNAEKYLERAVHSVLQQPETGEVILVEDHSPDNSLAVAQQLAEKYTKVKLLQHPDQKNHGAGPTRNVGIRHAKYDYIAFLDADDFYLENRFAQAKTILENDTTAEGVYECLGIHFESEQARAIWQKARRVMVTTLRQPASPDHLLNALLSGKYGSLHLDTLTLRKKVFQKTGYFSDARLAQDTLMIHKLAACCKLYPGSMQAPVAMRGVHEHNRITKSEQDNVKHELQVMEELSRWMNARQEIPRDTQKLMDRKIFLLRINLSITTRKFTMRKKQQLQLISYILNKPHLIMTKTFLKYLVAAFDIYHLMKIVISKANQSLFYSY